MAETEERVVLQSFGAARNVTGSRHLLKSGRARVLLDCGLFQGHRKESNERNRHLPVLPLDAVLLSHAHIDHSGALPMLVRDGFRGPIFATQATTDLCEPMLADSGALAEQDARYLNERRERGEPEIRALFTREDAARAMERFRPQPLGKPFDVAPGVRAVFREAGHILGSAGILVEFEGGPRVHFTGDLGRHAYPILKDPDPLPPCDAVISECTYGLREHEPIGDAETTLADVLHRCQSRRGKLFVPAFSVGRTQNFVYAYAQGRLTGKYPSLPIFVDSPLAAEATHAFASHPELFDAELRGFLARGGRPFDPPGVVYTRSVEDSKRLNDKPGPFVVIAGSGMCEGGRIVHHLLHGLPDPANAVLFIGYAAPDTLARRIVDGAKTVRIHGRQVEVNARVERIGAYSAHADRSDLLKFLAPARGWGATVFLVHGDEDACDGFARTLREEGHERVVVPECYAEYAIPMAVRAPTAATAPA
jgi:metallo-beta-lactamase family protein